MNKKIFKSIIITSFAGVGIWLAGFILIILLNFKNYSAVSRFWLIFMFAATLIVSVAKNIKK